jgi:hypothetical protein
MLNLKTFQPLVLKKKNTQQVDLFSKSSSFNSVEFLVDVWVEVLEESSIGKDDRITISINITYD